ncbi:MAG TPA: cupredoxin domain-containing protein [Actinomycetota bacterium]|nr:cupredoxin domain-containing protein [Actinomycetota bacterium]
MRRGQLLASMIILSLAAVACGGDNTTTPSAGGTTSPGATPPQPSANPSINNQGQLDATGMSAFSIELDDNYFKPTFIKAKTGQTLNIELEAEGASAHTFTITAMNIDHELAAGEKKEINLTLPAGTTDIAFFCRFHGSIGMQGAFFFGSAPTAAGSSGSDYTPDPY